MRLELGTPVRCTDGPAGELADVVIDPSRRRVTHVVVEPHHRHQLARLVPIELVAHDGASAYYSLELRCSTAELGRLEPVQELADLRLGELPRRDADWDVGVEDVYPMPFDGYGDLSPYTVNPDPHVWVSYDRVPRGEIELRRRSRVAYADGRRLGRVDGFALDAGDRVTEVVVECGHLWARRRVVIPVQDVAGLGTDEVTLRLTAAEAAS